jgi:MarR family transcriptional regulator, 2-MHQ and catechol-resistance regulon repressor
VNKSTNYSHLLSDEHISTGVNILSTSSRLMLFFSNQLKPFNLTFQQYNVLRILRQAGKPLSVKSISDAMIDPSSNCSRLVDKLALKGYAVRLEQQTDKRIVYVTLTESGIKLADIAVIDVLKHFKGKFDFLTTEDLSFLNSILEKLKTAIVEK